MLPCISSRGAAAERLASGSQASTSYVSSPPAAGRRSGAGALQRSRHLNISTPARSRRAPAATAACAALCQVGAAATAPSSTSRQRSQAPRPPPCARPWAVHRPSLACRVAAADAPAEEDEDEELAELDEANDTVYDSVGLVNKANIRPDFDDPGWVERVTSWEDFWYETEDVLSLEDEGDDGLSAVERGQRSLQRASALIAQLADLRNRSDVEQMIDPSVRPRPFYEDEYTSEQAFAAEYDTEYPDPNPDYNETDLRALAEKRRARAQMDAEWRRQQSLLAKPFRYTLKLDADARLASTEFDWIRETWTHEQILDLIVGGGKFADPAKIKAATVMNPLLPADFHNDVKAHLIPETEEFIASIGHLATEDELLSFNASQVALGERDFVDPSVVFQGRDGTTYMQAPPNRWAAERHENDAADVAMFEALVEKVQSRQRLSDALLASELGMETPASAALLAESGAAASAEGAGEGEGSDGPDGGEASDDGVDALLGEGFSAFMAEPSGVGRVFYEGEPGWLAEDLGEEDEGEGEGEDEGEGEGAS